MATTAAPAETAFHGFTREAIQFLVDLAANNDRTWFQPRKTDYERLLKRPLEALCAALDERFRARDIPLHADPARSPFRIHRDVRFSRDKSPYKTQIAASFPSAADRGPVADRHRYGGVGGYFSLAPGEIHVGGGHWQPEPASLAAWRTLVVEHNDEVHRAVDDPAFRQAFGELGGDRYQRVPAGTPADHPDADLLRLRQLIFSRRLSDDDALSPALPDVIADAFVDALPVIRLLSALPGGKA